MTSKVIVLGTLGELIKKICELELMERPDTKDTLIQMAAYFNILEKWPVEHPDQVKMMYQSFKVETARYIAVEKTLKDQIAVRPNVRMSEPPMLAWQFEFIQTVLRQQKIKDNLKFLIEKLNSLGKYVGPSPVTIELEEELDADIGGLVVSAAES